MHRRPFALLMLFFSLLALLPGCAQPGPGLPEIAVLLSDDVRLPKVEGLREGLSEIGYGAERYRLTIYSARGDRAALPDLAAQALASKPTVVVAGGGIEAVTLNQAANGSTPVVMMGVASTVRSGLVASFARPGGLITGVDNQQAELSAKRLDLLTKLLPAARRVLLLYDPLVIPGPHALAETQEAARKLGVAVTALEVSSLSEALAGLNQIEPGQFDAALFLPAFLLESSAALLTAELERLGLPTMGPLDLEGEAGLLAAYGVSNRGQGRQAARFVAKILRGESPGQIPVETPDNPELVVDLGVAKRLGLELSPVGMAFARVREEVAR